MAITNTTTVLRKGVLPTPRLGLILALVVVNAIAFAPSSEVLLNFWTDSENLDGTHGFLVLAVVAWLLFRARIDALDTQPSVAGFVGLAICSGVWLVLLEAGLQDLHVLMLPLIAWMAVVAAFGWRVGVALWFPFAFLYFAVPAWGFTSIPLQAITTAAVGGLSRIVGIPTHIVGNYVTIPEGTFEIARGCSGEHFMTVGLAVAALLGEFANASLRRRLLALVFFGAVAAVCNWLRVFIIVVAGHMTNMQHALITQGHYWFGWCVFAVGLALAIWFADRFVGPQGPDPAVAPSRVEAAPANGVRPWPVVAVLVVLSIAPLAAYVFERQNLAMPATLALSPPARDGMWRGPTPAGISDWQPQFVGAEGSVKASYVNRAGRTVEAYTVVYLFQRQGHEVVGEGNVLEGADGVMSTTANPTFRESIVKDARGEQFLVWSAYDIGGRRIVRPIFSQLWYGLRRASGATPYSALYAFRTSCAGSCADARATLSSFVGEVADEFPRSVRNAVEQAPGTAPPRKS
jgi:EpsI family protein